MRAQPISRRAVLAGGSIAAASIAVMQRAASGDVLGVSSGAEHTAVVRGASERAVVVDTVPSGLRLHAIPRGFAPDWVWDAGQEVAVWLDPQDRSRRLEPVDGVEIWPRIDPVFGDTLVWDAPTRQISIGGITGTVTSHTVARQVDEVLAEDREPGPYFAGFVANRDSGARVLLGINQRSAQ